MGDALLSEDAGTTAGKPIVAGESPGVDMLGRDATEWEAKAGRGSRKQLAKRTGIRNDPHPSAETLLKRHHYDERLRRGLLQAAKNNSPLPEWLLRRKSYDRAGDFYVRLKAELVAPESRDQAKIKHMLEELGSSQHQDANQHDGADDTMPGQNFAHIEEADAEDIKEVLVEQPTNVMHQQLTGDGEHIPSSMQLSANTKKRHETMRRGLLKAAEKGILPSGWLQDRSVVSLGDFWVRLKEELVSTERDQAKVTRMLDELRASELQGQEATDDELCSAGEGELEKVEEKSSKQRGHPDNNEAELKMQGQPDMHGGDSDDDIFVRRPRRHPRLLARHLVEEEEFQ